MTGKREAGESSRGKSRDVRGTLRTVALVVAAVAALVLVVQNQEPVQTQFLFWSVEMPRFALLGGVYLLGAATGWVARRGGRR